MEHYFTTNHHHQICPQSCFNGVDINQYQHTLRILHNSHISYDCQREFTVEQDFNNTIIQLSYFEFKLDDLIISLKRGSLFDTELSFISIRGKKKCLRNAIETKTIISLQRGTYDVSNIKYKFDNNVLTITIPYKNVNNK